MDDMERYLGVLIPSRTASASYGGLSLVTRHESVILECSRLNRIHRGVSRLDPASPSDHLISYFRHFRERLLSLH